jgi:hypothetical protein
MRWVLLFLAFFGLSVSFAQENPKQILGAPGCGSAEEEFEVNRNKGQHPRAQLEAGKALMYVIQNDTYHAGRNLVTRIGMDGKWIGATRGNSYLYSPADPGERHLCVSWQGKGNKAAAFHFTAVEGKTYFFMIRNVSMRYTEDIQFGALDSDEAQLLMSTYTVSTWQPKK